MRIANAKIIIAAVSVIILVLVILWLRAHRGFIWPVKGKVTSEYGYRTHPVTGEKSSYHNGIDIGAAAGTPIKSPQAGTVENVFANAAGGNQVILLHKNGFKTGYAHLSRVDVQEGQAVKKGQQIGLVGATGRVTGPHLHFTMRDKSGELVDPLKYLT